MSNLRATYTPLGATSVGFNTDAAASVILAVFLVIAIGQANLGALAQAAKDDFLGTDTARPFWRWAVAVLILMGLANSPKTKPVFGPLLGVVLVAMLIETATHNKQSFANLNGGVKALFGFGPLPPPSPAPASRTAANNPAGVSISNAGNGATPNYPGQLTLAPPAGVQDTTYTT